jgi:NADH-quinone oxidoreductase E subunit
MSRRLQAQGAPFVFNEENLKKIDKAIAQYPKGRQASAVKTILDLGQRQNGGWVSQEVVEEVARLLDMPFMRVYEVASFYTLFKLAPVGKVHVHVCTTTPCWLRGSDSLLEHCKKRSEAVGSDTLSVEEVECLGGCVNAPLVQINDDFYEDLDEASLNTLLTNLLEGKPVEPGSGQGRLHSAPMGYVSSHNKKGESNL